MIKKSNKEKESIRKSSEKKNSNHRKEDEKMTITEKLVTEEIQRQYYMEMDLLEKEKKEIEVE
jgi:hypothetical protein